MNSDTSLAPGQKIGSYVLMEKLGTGGLGEVWKARDPRLNRVVALKFISSTRPGTSAGRELLREARAASALNHPNIVTIFEVGESAGGTYLAMEFVEGETLRARFKRSRVPLEEAFEIAQQVAAGLAAAHRHAIVHRDLKPENIMLRVDGYVKLVDFGLAKVLPWGEISTAGTVESSHGTETGQLVGTFTYMSPEQARGLRVSPASDVFSFGIVLYELLTGEHPFQAGTVMDTLNAILTKEPAPVSARNPAALPALASLVAQALQKEESRRFPSAVELVEHLKRARVGEVTPAPAALPAVRHKPRWMKAVGVALIAALLALAGWSLRPVGLFRDRGAAVAAPVQAVAVMTFRTAPEDARASSLAQSLPEDLGVALAATGLRVTSRSSVLGLSGPTDPRTVGTELGVDAVLEGSVRSYGNRFRVTVELVSTRTGFQLWSGSFTVEAQDLLLAGQQTAEQITARIQAGLAGAR